MKYQAIIAIALTATSIIAGEPEAPSLSFPANGILFESYSNLCQSVFRQLPANASVARIEVLSTDRALSVSTVELSIDGTNAFRHVFTNSTGKAEDWLHVKSQNKGQSERIGLTRDEVNDILNAAKAHIDNNEKILFMIQQTPTETRIMTGSVGAGNAGGGTIYVFPLINNKWVFRYKGIWKS